MGAYSSTPIIDKDSEDSENCIIRYGASSMQGWRVSQEDAHNCLPEFDKGTSYFAVYDGHGGAEVAQYTAQHLPAFLKDKVPAYKENKLQQALEDSFLDFDDHLREDHVMAELKEIAGDVDEEEDELLENGDGVKRSSEMKDLHEEATMPMEELLERYSGGGQLKNMLLHKAHGGGNVKLQSPMLRGKQTAAADSCTNESNNDKDIKANLAEDLANGHNEVSSSSDSAQNNGDSAAEKVVGTDSDSDNAKPKASTQEASSKGNEQNDEKTSQEQTDANTTKADASKSDDVEPAKNLSNGDETSHSDDIAGCSPITHPGSSDDSGPSGSTSVAEPCGSSSSGSSGAAGSSASTTRQSQDLGSAEIIDDIASGEESEEDSEEESDSAWNSEVEDEEDDEDDLDDEEDLEEEDMEGIEMITGDEDPGIGSGCTAVVALLRDRQLYVANAGDSRCVVCKAGKAVDMSIDHKPEDQLEHTRIKLAGGKVTQDGRVNGGLNLSRALGDHFYKRNDSLPLRDQMISALPDVKTLTVDEETTFMVLACDGIWNVMSSQDVVNFVNERLGAEKLSTICEEMFTYCLAPDCTGDGTGCDNMTCIIVSFEHLNGKPTIAATEAVKRPASTEPAEAQQTETKKCKSEEKTTPDNSDKT